MAKSAYHPHVVFPEMDEIVQTCNRWFGLFGATVVRELIDAGCKQLVIDQVIAAALEKASNLLK